MFPSYKVYVEPFVGAGNVILRKPKEGKEVINDKDEDVYIALKGIRDKAKYINDNINREYVNREDFKKLVGKKDPKSIIERMKSSFRNGKGWGGDQDKSRSIATNYEVIGDRLKDVIIKNDDYSKIIKDYDSKDTFFYLDPPYENSDKNKLYVHTVNQEDIRNLLKNIKGKFMLSINDSPYIRDLYKGFKIRIVDTTYTHLKTTPQKDVKELIITNY